MKNWSQLLQKRMTRRLGGRFEVRSVDGDERPERGRLVVEGRDEEGRLRCQMPALGPDCAIPAGGWWLIERERSEWADGDGQRGLFSEEKRATPAAVAALLTSAPVAVQLPAGELSGPRLAGLAWPELREPWISQLEVLGRRLCVEGASAEGRSVAGAVDRVAAECFELTLDELVELEAAMREG